MAMVFMSIYIGFPIFATYFMCKHFKDLSMVNLKQDFGEIYEGFFMRERKVIVYIIGDNLRKTFLCTAIVIWKDSFWVQMVVFFATECFMLIASGFIRVRKNSYDAGMDLFNETKLIVIMYHIMMFTDFVPLESQDMVGISCIITIAVGTSVNMISLFSQPCRLLKRKSRTRYHMKKAKIWTKSYKGLKIAANFDERRKMKADAEEQEKVNELIINLAAFRENVAETNDEQERIVTLQENDREQRRLEN